MQIEAGGNGGPPNINDNEDIEYLKLLCRSGGLIGGIIFQGIVVNYYFSGNTKKDFKILRLFSTLKSPQPAALLLRRLVV